MNKRVLKSLIKFDTKNRNKWIQSLYKQEGMSIGENTHIFSLVGGEPYLIEIGSNCTISTEVSFITHDASVGAILGRENVSDLCGKIRIGNNVFIGNKSILLYGVTLGNNTIVAAGSVVTKSFPGNVVIGGNPARIICSTDEFIAKSKGKCLNLHGLSYIEKRNILLSTDKYIER